MNVASWKMRAGFAVAFLFVFASIETVSAQGGNNPPIIVGLVAAQVSGKKFQISGRVADETPTSCSVVLSGVASATLTCDSGGNFSGIVSVPVLGTLEAIATDGQLWSEVSALIVLNNAGPTTTIVATHGFGNNWTISGVVTDEAPPGLTVTLSGPPSINGRTATVGRNGAWSISVIFGQSFGFATATVTDWYGLTGSASTPIG